MNNNKKDVLLLEDFIPYHKSMRWKITDNYYKTRGKSAWLKGEIPYYATSNSIAARQNVAIVYNTIELMHVQGILKKTEPINILEMASGLGLFAINFLRAFRSLDLLRKKNYFKRLKYYFTDYSIRNLEDASKVPILKKLVKEGIILFAELNALEPEKLRFLGSDNFQRTPKMAAVIANYMHVVLPVKLLWKKDSGFYEKYLKTSLKITEKTKNIKTVEDAIKSSSSVWGNYIGETSWNKIKTDYYEKSSHKKIVEFELAKFDEAKIVYPYGSFVNIEKTMSLIASNGIYLISDAAFSNIAQMIEAGKRGNDFQGKDRLLITINMPFLEPFAKSLGYQTIRTVGEYDEIQTIMIVNCKNQILFPQFKKIFVEENINREACDFYWAGNKLVAAKHYKAAIRIYNRVMKFQPEDADIYYQLGIVLAKQGELEKSIKMFKKGILFDYFKISDFDFGFGFTYQCKGEYISAITSYKRSLINKKSEITFYNIGLCYEKLNKVDLAIKYYLMSLNINPKYYKSKERILKLKSMYEPNLPTTINF